MTNLLDLVLRSAGLAFGLVLALVLASGGGWRRRADLLAVVGCACAYLVCATPSRPCCASPAGLPLLLGAIGFPFAFWRLGRVVLQDDRSVPAAAQAALAALLASGVLAAMDGLAPSAAWRLASAGLNKALAFGFVVTALLAAWRSWDGDLVEPRRRLRWVLIAYLGLYGSVVLAAEVYLFGQAAPAWLEAVNAFLIAATLLATLLFLVQVRVQALDTLFAGAPAAPAVRAGPASTDEPLLAQLQVLMAEEKIYRDQELSVPSLARRLAVPEYVLRRLINERLGYRNFAGFVNEYRLLEVSGRLSDPALDRRPILTLALEAGFGSIGPFNRFFRQRFGMTPSEFRRARAAAPAVSPAAR